MGNYVDLENIFQLLPFPVQEYFLGNILVAIEGLEKLKMSHADLHFANIVLVKDDEKDPITKIIDWKSLLKWENDNTHQWMKEKVVLVNTFQAWAKHYEGWEKKYEKIFGYKFDESQITFGDMQNYMKRWVHFMAFPGELPVSDARIENLKKAFRQAQKDTAFKKYVKNQLESESEVF